jgi:hypothetical protein
MKRFKGTETVNGGYYLELHGWKLEAVDGRTGQLPGDEGKQYVRIPLFALLAVAPLLGLAFVVLLPFLGLGVVAEQLWAKAAGTVRAPHARPARPVMNPRR